MSPRVPRARPQFLALLARLFTCFATEIETPEEEAGANHFTFFSGGGRVCALVFFFSTP